MATRQLAFTQSVPGRSKKSRSRGRRGRAAGAAAPPSVPVFSELEQAFFASAPPDQPGPAPAPECFDDLNAPAPAPQPQRWLQGLVRAVATARAAFRRLVIQSRP